MNPEKRKRTLRERKERLHKAIGKALKLETRVAMIEEVLRKIFRELEKCRLREQQIILMFKMLLDKGYRRTNPPTMRKIVAFMEELVMKNASLVESENEEPPDLLSEILKNEEEKK